MCDRVKVPLIFATDSEASMAGDSPVDDLGLKAHESRYIYM